MRLDRLHPVRIPPGGCAKPHRRRGFETAIGPLRGRVEARYGTGAAKSVINETGDLIFSPPNPPHQPFDPSDSEPAQEIVARNVAGGREQVVLDDPAAGG